MKRIALAAVAAVMAISSQPAKAEPFVAYVAADIVTALVGKQLGVEVEPYSWFYRDRRYGRHGRRGHRYAYGHRNYRGGKHDK